jgi:hypothetical protein
MVYYACLHSLTLVTRAQLEPQRLTNTFTPSSVFYYLNAFNLTRLLASVSKAHVITSMKSVLNGCLDT